MIKRLRVLAVLSALFLGALLIGMAAASVGPFANDVASTSDTNLPSPDDDGVDVDAKLQDEGDDVGAAEGDLDGDATDGDASGDEATNGDATDGTAGTADDSVDPTVDSVDAPDATGGETGD